MSRHITLPALALLLAAMATVLGARDARAFNPQPDPPGFGLVSINASVEIARLSVGRVGATAPGPCQLGLAFYDERGALLAQSRVSIGDPNIAQALVLDRAALAG